MKEWKEERVINS